MSDSRHWKTVRLGDVAPVSKEKGNPLDQPNASYIGLEHIERNIASIIGHGVASEVRSTKSVFRTGDLLYGKLRPYLNKVWIAEFDGLCSTDILVFPQTKNTENKFLKYRFMASDFVRYAAENSSGVNLPRVNSKVLAQFPLYIPETLAEQRRIVAEIEKQFARLDAGVAGLKRVQTNLKRYRASVLKSACEGRLVPTEAELCQGVLAAKERKERKKEFETGEQLLERILVERRKAHEEQQKTATRKKKYKQPAAPDTKDLPKLPEGWCWASVDSIGFVTKLAGFEYTKFVNYSEDGDLPVIKAENAGRFGFKRTTFSMIDSFSVSHLTRSQVIAGDLLMVFVGAGTGNVAHVPDDQPYFLGPNIAMIRIKAPNVLSTYPEIFLRSPIGNALALGFSKAVAQPSISMGNIRMIPIALPPLAEQKRIVAEVERRLSVVEEMEATVEANLKRAGRLRQSILKRAFEGELV